MSRPNVLQVNKLYFPHIGGIESTLKELSEGLKDRANLTVLVSQKSGLRTKEELINGVRVIRTSSLGMALGMPLSPIFPVVFSQLAAKNDIIHLHFPFPIGELSYLLRRPKAKLVITWHSDIVRQSQFLRWYEPIFLRVLDLADIIIVETPNMISGSAYLEKFTHKCRVIPVGIEEKKYVKSAEIEKKVRNLREQYGDKLLLFIGRLVYYKGIDYLIEAMKRVEGNLIIIGDGPLKTELTKEVEKAGLQDKVFFLGYLPEEELLTYLHACDVFVFPSTEKTETFGRVQVEAMLSGKPVINTWLPTGVPYVSVDGITGLTVPPKSSEALGNAINELLNNEEKRMAMGTAARERAKNLFSLNAMIQGTLRIYEKLLNV